MFLSDYTRLSCEQSSEPCYDVCILDCLQNDVIDEKWLMKMDVEMAAQFDVPNDVKRNPTIVWRKLKNRRIEFLDVLLIKF